jgi:PAS domain S-box-containing protein
MTTLSLLTLRGGAPPGFELVDRGDVLAGGEPRALYVGALQEGQALVEGDALEVLEAELPGFAQAFSGIVVTPGRGGVERLGPRLWVYRAPPEDLDRLAQTLPPLLQVIDSLGQDSDRFAGGDAPEASQGHQSSDPFPRRPGSTGADVKSAANAAQLEFFWTLIDHMPNQIFWKDTELRYRGCNREFARVVGLADPRDVEGLNDYDFARSAEHAERYRRDDRDVICSRRAVLFQEEKYHDCRGLEGDILTCKIPIVAASGQVAGVLGFCVDVTERNRMLGERQLAHAQLAEAQKMESLALLSRGVAHDFNNITSAIVALAEDALRESGSSERVRANVEQIVSVAFHSAELSRHLLRFALQQESDACTLNTSEYVAELMATLKHLVGRAIGLRWSPAGELWPIRIAPCQLDQVLVNLVVNSRDAVQGIGDIVIAAENVALTETSPLWREGLVPSDLPFGDYVALSVTDSGQGMPLEVLDRIFEPLFTTKSRGKGTGVGLATVYEVVEQNRGGITVITAVGVGSKFVLYLPRARNQTSWRPSETSRYYCAV